MQVFEEKIVSSFITLEWKHSKSRNKDNTDKSDYLKFFSKETKTINEETNHKLGENILQFIEKTYVPNV